MIYCCPALAPVLKILFLFSVSFVWISFIVYNVKEGLIVFIWSGFTWSLCWVRLSINKQCAHWWLCSYLIHIVLLERPCGSPTRWANMTIDRWQLYLFSFKNFKWQIIITQFRFECVACLILQPASWISKPYETNQFKILTSKIHIEKQLKFL